MTHQDTVTTMESSPASPAPSTSPRAAESEKQPSLLTRQSHTQHAGNPDTPSTSSASAEVKEPPSAATDTPSTSPASFAVKEPPSAATYTPSSSSASSEVKETPTGHTDKPSASSVPHSEHHADIGPYASDAGLTARHFNKDEHLELPLLQVIKCGLVLELVSFLTGISFKLSVSAVADILKKLGGNVEASTKSVAAFIKSVKQKDKKIRQNEKKGKTQEQSLFNLHESEFRLVRERASKEVDTPRKRRLKEALDAERAHKKSVVKKLCVSELTVATLKEELAAKEEGTAQMTKEVAAKSKQIEEMQQAIDEVNNELTNLKEQHETILTSFEEVQAKFNPMNDELTLYKTVCEAKSEQLESLENKMATANSKLSKLNARNVNKRIQRRDKEIKHLKSEKAKSVSAVTELEEELKQTQAKLNESKLARDKLAQVKQSNRSLSKKIRYRNMKLQEKQGATSQDSDVLAYEKRIDTLNQRVRELEECLVLCEDEKIVTFADGKYTNQIRELIMELLTMNVAMSKVGKIIQATISKLTTIDVGRLPSISTISKLITEAKVLADIEVGLAMEQSSPESALGNVIHGDGTTKFHKKYQNFQVTLADGTSRSMGLMQVGRSDTTAVMESFKERVAEIAEELASTTQADKTDLYNRLIVSITSTMTDQGPTMPQFSEKIQVLRDELLPVVVDQWETLPQDVKQPVMEFGTFFCKMHPLINFAEEVNKTLKSFEDIATTGKNAHTITTSEAGATRLVRTASKAFHHRGSDKSGVEDVFSVFISKEYGEKNHLVQYVGEGAASTYFHLKHMVNFVNLLPDANMLLLAVCEDAQERINIAELKALGLVHKVITEPFWQAVKCAKNILSLNDVLHQLQQKLNVWKDDPSGIMNGEEAFEGAQICQDQIYECLIKPTDDVEVEGMCVQALELICCAILLILERQCKDNLPGGKYWEPSEMVSNKFSNVPATNLIGERDFALLDMLVRQKPSARTITLEAIVMWTNNKTVEWLDNLDISSRNKYMDLARRHAPEVLQKYHERMKEIKKQRWESLQEKQRAREAKEKKAVSDRVKQTDDIVQQGGVWVTENRINEEFGKINETMTNEEVRRELHKQLMFHQKILKSEAPSRELFQLSATVAGKRKAFSKDEMKDHLVTIIRHNAFTSSDPAQLTAQNQENPTPAVSYTSTSTLDDRFEEKKKEIGKKLEEERKKRAIKNSKLHLTALIDAPHQLLNKHVEHKCINPAGIQQWYKGTITEIGEVAGINTIYTIRYEEDALEPEEEVCLEFPLLKDLKKNDLIITDKLA